MRDPPECWHVSYLLLVIVLVEYMKEGPMACLTNTELSTPPKKPETAIKEDKNKKPVPHSQITLADMRQTMTPVCRGSMKK